MGLSRIMKVLGATGLVALTTMSGCGDDGDEKAAGSEGGPCYGNGTCNPGLSCLSQLCVAASGTGGNAGAGSGGSSGKGGSGGKAGTGGSTGGTGTGGTRATGGSTGGGGASNGGEPGAGGEGGSGLTETCMGTTLGTDPECNHCFVVNCCDQYTACTSDAACVECLSGAPCDGNELFTTFDNCLNVTCAENCIQ